MFSFNFSLAYLILISVCSYFLLNSLRKYIILLNLYPKSKARDLHQTPTPGFLGAGFVVLFFIGSFFYEKLFLESLHYNSLIIALLIITAGGVRDDLLEISSKEKMLYELMAINLFLNFNSYLVIDNLYGFLGIHELPYSIGYLFTVFIGVVVINSFNLIDGIDGNAGFNGILSFSLFGILFWVAGMPEFMGLCILLVSILSGYLFINFSTKSKGFMGDTGSLFIGFLIFVFTIVFVNTDSIIVENLLPTKALIPLAPLCIFILPLIDTLSIYSYRISIGKNPLSPDNYHLHHLALNLFSKNHLSSALFLNGLSLLFCVFFSILVFRLPAVYSILSFFLAVTFLVLLTNRLRIHLRRKNGKNATDVVLL